MRVNKNVITLIEHKVLIHGMGTVTLTISMPLRQKKRVVQPHNYFPAARKKLCFLMRTHGRFLGSCGYTLIYRFY